MDDGLKTLLAMFKGSYWRSEISVSEEDISCAKEKGYLFDYPAYESHADSLHRLNSIISKIDPTDIADAFLFSLSTRKLEYRSALGSYYYAKAVREHSFMASHNETLAAAAVHCYLCGWDAWQTSPSKFELLYEGYNRYNYERYKFGGVRHAYINYALFDLEQFTKLPKVTPADEDRQILTQILSCVDRLNNSDKVGKLRDTIVKAKIFKSNKDEVSVLLDELGICGILTGKDYPSYDVYFANEYERAPVEHRNDFAYPVNRWYARDGINTEKLKEVFGDGFIDH
ncbi:MAG: hypothetical protein E7523_00730 [Ruminococcaceae bacterium]|nr:hypothetical protein [Oscillospiraceae bacterium]